MRGTGLALIVALVLCPSTAIGAEEGSAIFRGTEASDRAARIAGVPQTGLRCSGCHGRDASGARTGSADIPAVNGRTLSGATPARPPYDRALFSRALREGLRSDGRPLALAMPRFSFDDEEVETLWRFLAQIEADERLGVAPDHVRFAVAARPAGRAAAEALRTSLEAAWAALGAPRVNGRRVSFETRIADAAGAEFRDVFAVVDPEPGTMGGTGLAAALAGDGIPVIGPSHVPPPPGGDGEPDIAWLAGGEDAVEAFMAEASSEPGRFGSKPARFIRTARQLSRFLEENLRPSQATIVVSIFAAENPEDLVRLARRGAETILVRPADPPRDPEALAASLAFLMQAGLAAAGRDLTRTHFLQAVSRLRPTLPAGTASEGVDLLRLTSPGPDPGLAEIPRP